MMRFELTRGDVYCCNTELNCTQCNDSNPTVSLKCCTYQQKITEVFSSQCPTVTIIPHQLQ